MQKFTVTAPDGVTLVDLRGMLPAGFTVTENKPRKPKTASATPDFEPVIVYRDGAPIREIDGVSAQKAIAKLMAEVNRGKKSDGRHPHDYPDWGARPDAAVAEYAQLFCANLKHKKAEYTPGFAA